MFIDEKQSNYYTAKNIMTLERRFSARRTEAIQAYFRRASETVRMNGEVKQHQNDMFEPYDKLGKAWYHILQEARVMENEPDVTISPHVVAGFHIGGILLAGLWSARLEDNRALSCEYFSDDELTDVIRVLPIIVNSQGKYLEREQPNANIAVGFLFNAVKQREIKLPEAHREEFMFGIDIALQRWRTLCSQA